MIEIISGLQTGVDWGDATAAHTHNACGICWVPRGSFNEKGPIPNLVPGGFRTLEVSKGGIEGYKLRTFANIRDSNGTLIIARDRNQLSGGTQLTIDYAEGLGRPRFCFLSYDMDYIQTHLAVIRWLKFHNIRILNVAGPRGSKWPEGEKLAFDFVDDLCKTLKTLQE